MKIAQPSDGRRAVRMLALAWVAVAVAVAALQVLQVASALDTGLMGFPSRLAAVIRASRTGEPALFHAMLLGSMLLGLLCLCSVTRVWHVVSGRRAVLTRSRQ
jgi:hypothetical protein